MEVETLCKISVSPVRKPSRRPTPDRVELTENKAPFFFSIIIIMKALILKLRGALPPEPL